jgi:hypothetical protein
MLELVELRYFWLCPFHLSYFLESSINEQVIGEFTENFSIFLSFCVDSGIIPSLSIAHLAYLVIDDENNLNEDLKKVCPNVSLYYYCIHFLCSCSSEWDIPVLLFLPLVLMI